MSNIDNLIKACQNNNKEDMSNILNDKILPNNESLKSLFHKYINYYYNNNNNDDDNNDNNDNYDLESLKKKYSKLYEIKSEIKEQCINLLQMFGYVPSKNDVLLTIYFKVKISNIEISYFNDDVFLQKMKMVCDYVSFFPYDQIKPDESSLINILNTKKVRLVFVKNFIKKYNIIPTILSLKTACKHLQNQAIVNYLITTYNIEPDFDCILSSPNTDKQIFMMVKFLKDKYEKI
jgi:hypothetical protein